MPIKSASYFRLNIDLRLRTILQTRRVAKKLYALNWLGNAWKLIATSSFKFAQHFPFSSEQNALLIGENTRNFNYARRPLNRKAWFERLTPPQYCHPQGVIIQQTGCRFRDFSAINRPTKHKSSPQTAEDNYRTRSFKSVSNTLKWRSIGQLRKWN